MRDRNTSSRPKSSVNIVTAGVTSTAPAYKYILANPKLNVNFKGNLVN